VNRISFGEMAGRPGRHYPVIPGRRRQNRHPNAVPDPEKSERCKTTARLIWRSYYPKRRRERRCTITCAMRLWCKRRKRSIFAGKGATRLTAMLSVDDLFKGRHFDREIIILCVRWYLRFKLSFRDLVEMMAERGLSLAHTTIMGSVANFRCGRERPGTMSWFTPPARRTAALDAIRLSRAAGPCRSCA
jgi:hypothetical protein